MERIAWLVLHDGRSVVAACGEVTKERLGRALSDPHATLTISTDDLTERIAGRDVRDYVIFESKSAVTEAVAHRFLRV